MSAKMTKDTFATGHASLLELAQARAGVQVIVDVIKHSEDISVSLEERDHRGMVFSQTQILDLLDSFKTRHVISFQCP